MSLQRRAFDPSLNPFLRATNPFRIQEKFHSSASSEEKSKKGFFTKHFYDSNCDHCIKNSPLLEEMNARSTFLKAQKQNFQKVTSTKFKTGKLRSNPFEKSRLLGQDINASNKTYGDYSIQDDVKLQSLLYNNPFRKHTQQKQHLDKEKGFEIEFKEINLVQLTPKQKFENVKRESIPRLISPSHERKSSARFSIDCTSNRIKQNDNSPRRKSKFSPTVGDIVFASNRGSSSRNSIVEGESNQPKFPCLMQQITQSRKELFQHHRPEKKPQVFSTPTSHANIPPKSLFEQKNQENQEDSKVITVRGKKFYLNQVKFRY